MLKEQRMGMLKKQRTIKKYQYNCINPDNKKELESIMARSREIPYLVFIKSVERNFIKDFEKIYGYLGAEQYASFHKSITPDGKIVFFFTHSAIEYIFY